MALYMVPWGACGRLHGIDVEFWMFLLVSYIINRENKTRHFGIPDSICHVVPRFKMGDGTFAIE